MIILTIHQKQAAQLQLKMNVSSLIVGEMKSEQVLNLELIPVQEAKVEGDTTERRRQWTVQRIRLSPQEKHLAATVKSHRCTAPR